MATLRVRYDRDLGHVVVEQVGGPVTHIEAKHLSDAEASDQFEVYATPGGGYALTGGEGRVKVATARKGNADQGVVTAASLPHTAVTDNDLVGKPRTDLYVPGQSEKHLPGGDGSVPAPILTKSALGQSANETDVNAALAPEGK